MLCPENVDVLGGSVMRLMQAREATKAVLMKEPRTPFKRHGHIVTKLVRSREGETKDREVA